jgi:hypothetical protein
MNAFQIQSENIGFRPVSIDAKISHSCHGLSMQRLSAAATLPHVQKLPLNIV